jgi:hypothetical protein
VLFDLSGKVAIGIDLAEKDMRLAIDLAAATTRPRRRAPRRFQHCSNAQRRGLGGQDVGALWDVVGANGDVSRSRP